MRACGGMLLVLQPVRVCLWVCVGIRGEHLIRQLWESRGSGGCDWLCSCRRAVRSSQRLRQGSWEVEDQGQSCVRPRRSAMESTELFLVSLGAVVLLYVAWKLLAILQLLFPKAWYPLPKSFFSSMGEWAVITGGSEGIGRAYAFELARRGLNIVIISRTLAKLKAAAKEIGEITGREVKLIVADFTKDDVYEHIEENLTGLNVGVLVNNVGILPSQTPCKLLDTEDLEQKITNVINCNVKASMKMCRIILPQMSKRGKGLILNLSSGVALVPCPLYSMYGASKICVERFSRCLQAEYKSKGIIIQVLTPFGVSTLMTGFQKPDLITFTAEEFVRTSLNYVLAGDHTYGSISHQLMGWILQAIPIQFLHSDAWQEKLLEYVKKKVNENK